MAAEESKTEEVPMLTVRVLMLSGYVCSVAISSTCTVWDLKRYMKRFLSISTREMTLLVGGRVPGMQETLASIFGAADDQVDVTIVRTQATCLRCGFNRRVQYCQRCRATYCSAACQRADWRSHRRECLKAAV